LHQDFNMVVSLYTRVPRLPLSSYCSLLHETHFLQIS